MKLNFFALLDDVLLADPCRVGLSFGILARNSLLDTNSLFEIPVEYFSLHLVQVLEDCLLALLTRPVDVGDVGEVLQIPVDAFGQLQTI